MNGRAHWICVDHFKFVDTHHFKYDVWAAAGIDLQPSDTLNVLPSEVRGGGAGQGQQLLPICEVCSWVRSLS